MAYKPTKRQAEDMAEMIEDGKSLSDIRMYLKTNEASSLHSLIAHCIFLSVDKRSPEQETIRAAILDALLGESVLRKALKAVSQDMVKRSTKVTTLSALSATEKKTLEKQGYTDFIEDSDMAAVILKVEETKETIPPDMKLLEKLLGLVDGSGSVDDVAKQLAAFSPPHPDTPEV